LYAHTLTFSFASAAATSSWVLKGLHPVIATSAPPAISALTRTPVSFVTCNAIPMRIPLSGFSLAKRCFTFISACILDSAISRFRKPCSASLMSLTS